MTLTVRTSSGRRGGTVFLTALAVLAAVVAVPGIATAAGSPAGAAPPARVAAPDRAAKPSPDAAAAGQARATGKPVEVTASRTETNEVVANPDGTFTMTAHARPVRVHRTDGSWVPVDTTLARRPDGTVGPKATTIDVAFSGGPRSAGSHTVVRLARGGRTLALRWPAALPAPVLVGDTATYRNLRPGVDLRVTADVDGFSDVLVVRDRAAAAALARHPVSFEVRGDGLTTRLDRGGILTAVDGDGHVVFRGGAPLMWDSAGPEPHTAAVRTRLAGHRLTLLPDTRLLTSPYTRFPVSVDPYFNAAKTAWTAAWKEFPGQSYWNAKDVARLGWEDVDAMTVRPYFQLDTHAINDKHILAATFRIWENWSYSCTPKYAVLWEVSGISSATTWNNQPSYLKNINSVNAAKGYGANCPAGNLEFNAYTGVVDAANGNWPNLTLGLLADEQDTLAWKKFNNDPALVIQYNTPPATPTNVSVSDCYLQCASPALVSKADATLRAKVSDVDGDLLRAVFEVWNADYSQRICWEEYSVTSVPSGGTASWQQNTPRTDANTYHLRVRSADTYDYSPWTAWFTFSTDLVAPDKPPAVTSADYPSNKFTGGVGVAGDFAIDPAGVADVAEYRWGIDVHDDPATKIAPTTVGGPVTLNYSPTTDGPHTLFVRSVDAAGNLSGVSRYRFFVKGATGPEGWWKLDETTGNTAADATGDGHTLTASGAGAVTWAPGHDGNAAHFARGGALTAADPIVYSEVSFTVSAWVELDDKNDYATAVSQDGQVNSSFYLQYQKAQDRWAFAMPRSDTVNPVQDQVFSKDPAQVGKWTHLVGVFDGDSGELRLYVDGALQGTAAHVTPWASDGPFEVGGASWANHSLINLWSGGIDDVQVFYWPLSDAEVGQL